MATTPIIEDSRPKHQQTVTTSTAARIKILRAGRNKYKAAQRAQRSVVALIQIPPRCFCRQRRTVPPGAIDAGMI